MKTQAEKLIEEFGADNSNEIVEAAERLTEPDQDWENEQTVYQFDDGSTLVLSGPCAWVDEPTECRHNIVRNRYGYSARCTICGMTDEDA